MTTVSSTAPPRSGRARPPWAAPVLHLAAVAATLVVAVRSPEESGHYPTCPFLAITGWWCPGCGSLRAVHALAHGDVGTAIDRNVLTVAAIPFAAIAWVMWLVRRTRPQRPPGRGVPAPAIWAGLILLVAFGVFRNTGPGAWFAP
ncbi:MAG TPA: DUF2752 domain-containing protein [Sporichthya sp.]|nr:DUF2752 domain-containing protein [Sporichthya sp.]